VIENKWMSAAEFDAAISPEAVCRLGSPPRAEADDPA
jgi:hypothetical protein